MYLKHDQSRKPRIFTLELEKSCDKLSSCFNIFFFPTFFYFPHWTHFQFPLYTPELELSCDKLSSFFNILNSELENLILRNHLDFFFVNSFYFPISHFELISVFSSNDLQHLTPFPLHRVLNLPSPPTTYTHKRGPMILCPKRSWSSLTHWAAGTSLTARCFPVQPAASPPSVKQQSVRKR